MSFYEETVHPNHYLAAVRVFSAAEHAEILKTYGKPVSQLTAPEGYEFTGEFRRVKDGDLFYSAFDWLQKQVSVAIRSDEWALKEPRLILREIEEKEPVQLAFDEILEALETTSPGYTAADIVKRYGQNVLDVFGYREGSLRDHPGFVYSGELTNVNPGEWYVYAGKPCKYELSFPSTHANLTLIPTDPPEPRIVQFTLTAKEDFEGEAIYIQDDLGGFMTAAGAPEGVALYSRSEVA